MRPLQLTACAFGPYADVVHVDFEALSERGVFLVHGATGAGKSTLLDAICFALYGVTSGGERSAKQMRSDFARASVGTEVSLTFSARDALYRVQRSPEHERRKKRGEGTTTAKGEVRLCKLIRTPAGEDVEETLATKVADVDSRIRDLLGLNAEQFRQVVVLPQGRFRELLVASSTKRQEILESLFGAERIRALEDALVREEKTRRAQVEAVSQKVELLKRHAAADGIDDVEGERQALKDKMGALERELNALVEASEDRKIALQQFQAAKAANDALVVAQEALSKWEATKGERQQRAERLALAERAAAIRAEVEAAWTAKEHARHASNRLATNEAEWSAAKEAVRDAEAAMAALLSASPPADDEREQLRAALPHLAVGERLQLLLHQAQEAKAVAEKDLAQVQQEIETAAKTLEDKKKKRAEAQQIAHRLEPRRAQYLATMRSEQQLKKAIEGARQVMVERETLRGLEKEQERRRNVLDDVRRQLQALRDQQRASVAAKLAATLQEGEACPVCGATDHPRLAIASDGAVQLRDEMHLDDELVRAQEQLASIESTSAASRQALHGAVERVRGILEAMDIPNAARLTGHDWNEDDLEALQQEMTKAITAVAADVDRFQSALAEAEAAHDDLAAMQDDLAAEKERYGKLQGSLAALSERTEKARADVDHAEAEVRRHQEASPIGSTIDHASALARLRELDAEKTAQGKARAAAETAVAKAKAEAQTADALMRAAVRDKEAAFERQRATEKALASALEEHGFADAADAEKASLDSASFSALRRQVESEKEEDRAKASEVQRREFALAAFASMAEPLTAKAEEELAAKVAELEADVASRTQERGRLAERLANLERWGEDIALHEADLERARTAHQAIAPVAHVASGQNAQKITFQRWVLATLLDDVLETASVRLLKMTRGRYAMKRRLDPRGRGGRGLDLDVIDHETQVERPVATLSGGESFLAALALALGLADAVRARAGGVLLDAIFLDEGFAGLDPEALDLALATLQELMDSGRMVGIISHVDELKERIPHGLEVKSGRRGSRVVTFGAR